MESAPSDKTLRGKAFDREYALGLPDRVARPLRAALFAEIPPGTRSLVVVCHSEPGAWAVLSGQLFQTEPCPPSSPSLDMDRVAVVGRVAFETDRLGAEHRARINAMDAVWVPTRWQADVFAAAGVTAPVRVIPEPVDTDFYRPLSAAAARGAAKRAPGAFVRWLDGLLGVKDAADDDAADGDATLSALPLPLAGAQLAFPAAAAACGEPRQETFSFLSVFKWEERKAWDVLARAFSAEFAPDEGVALHVLTSEYHNDAKAFLEQFRDAAGGAEVRACAYVSAEHVSQADMPRLYGAADVFVLASRGEGWGRPHAEALSCGVPVIATNWSGPTEFVNERNGYLVEVERMVEITDENSPFRGHRWAEPSVSSLRRRMREAVADAAGRRARGAAARRESVLKYGVEAVGKLTLAAAKEAALDRQLRRKGRRAAAAAELHEEL